MPMSVVPQQPQQPQVVISTGRVMQIGEVFGLRASSKQIQCPFCQQHVETNIELRYGTLATLAITLLVVFIV